MKNPFLINNLLSAILIIPDNDNKKIPAVIFLYGFGSDKNEVGDTFLIAAEKLRENKIASLRFDFSGFGESKGETSETTIEKLISDANTVL